MEFRRATTQDIDQILALLGQAREHLRRSGVDQWQNGYPNREVVEQDLRAENAWLLLDDGQVVGTAALVFGREADYDVMDGDWLTGGDLDCYAVLHRVAVSDAHRGRGLAARLFTEAEAVCRERGAPSLRSDTHPDNAAMLHLLEKHGFTRCGTISLQGSPRVTFEKIL